MKLTVAPLLYVNLFTLDLSEALDKRVFYDCLLSAPTEGCRVMDIQGIPDHRLLTISMTRLYSLKWPVRCIFKGRFIKYVLSNHVHLLL